ncbi:hypothetical protein RRG08_032833 [Elysia crispata]|uniref:Uncharacterized protein n=1 Tax=Elysia crispata TaxID=231223 RepID=A0AAE1DXI8_9GAST|nr:hypothetical protein RRG08_032833 [Elysia crispata]
MFEQRWFSQSIISGKTPARLEAMPSNRFSKTLRSRRWLTFWFLLNTVAQSCGKSERDIQFEIISGQRINSGLTVLKQVSGFITSVKCAAVCGESCGVFHYSAVDDICVVFAESHLDAGFSVTSDANWAIGKKFYDKVTKNGWTLAFRGQKEIGVQVWDTWSATGVSHDFRIPADFPQACLRMANYSSCDRHFRSHILDNWVNIQRVYMSWMKNDAEVAYIIFNGTGTDRDSWFQATRILSSNWAPSIINDIPLLHTQSIYGNCKSISCRRFYLHGPHTDCTTEWSYSYTLDLQPDWCYWNGMWGPTLSNNIPIFAYSPWNGRAAMGTDDTYPDLETADALVIWVEVA